MFEYPGRHGRNVVGQLYDPFYYFPRLSYAQHPEVGGALMQCWLTSTHTRLLAVGPDKSQYLQFVADHPDWFTEAGTVPLYGWTLEDVHVPALSAADCAAANRAASG